MYSIHVIGFLVALVSFSHLHVKATAPTVKPTSVPPVLPDTFYVRDNSTGLVCLVVRLNATFHIPYNTTDKKSSVAKVSLLNNTNTNVTGNCSQGWNGKSGESITLQWKPSSLSPVWNLSLYLAKSADNKSFEVSQLVLQYNRSSDIFVNATDRWVKHDISAVPNNNQSVSYFKTTLGQYYQCTSLNRVDFTEKAYLDVNLVLISAFRNKSATIDFQGERYQCYHDILVHDLVPIIVGVTLALLIVVVLIAYLIGRQRTHVGYQSI